ncbi:hypothetical protein ACEPAF_2219 [Sanghuangporus sanghuang]
MFLRSASTTFRPLFGHPPKLTVIAGVEWYCNDEDMRKFLLGLIGPNQWERRGFNKTSITVLLVTSSGVHTSTDKHKHFTARAFNDNGEAVWFFDTKYKYYTNGVHFYPDGLPADLELNRFVEIPANDENLIKWCAAHSRDIKTAKKIEM